jgi:hypothetical protein
MWGLRQHTLLGVVVGLCASGNTLLGITVGLCGTSGNTLYWVLLLVMLRLGQHTLLALLLLVYEGPRTTHFTDSIVVGYARFGATLYWASLGLMWGAFINVVKIILFF